MVNKKVNFSNEKFLCFPKSLGFSKKGQNITLGTILLMLLGVVVVVILLWGTTRGFDHFWNTLMGYGGSSNVDTIKNACALACSSSQEYAFCEDVRTVKKGDGSTLKGSCETLGSIGVVESCSGISCDVDKLPKKCGALLPSPGDWQKDSCGDQEDLTSQVGDTSDKGDDDKYCCGA